MAADAGWLFAARYQTRWASPARRHPNGAPAPSALAVLARGWRSLAAVTCPSTSSQAFVPQPKYSGQKLTRPDHAVSWNRSRLGGGEGLAATGPGRCESVVAVGRITRPAPAAGAPGVPLPTRPARLPRRVCVGGAPAHPRPASSTTA